MENNTYDEIVDALGNVVGKLKKITRTNLIGTDGVRYKRAYSSGVGYEVKKRKRE